MNRVWKEKRGKKRSQVSSPSTGRVQRMVPELATLSYTVTGNRQYQQDADLCIQRQETGSK